MKLVKKIFEDRRAGFSLVVIVVLVTSVLSYFFTTKWNPEIIFWSEAVETKSSWRDKLADEESGPVAVVFGGSTTGFGIDAEYASEELGYAMVNMGLHAGMGAEALCGFALAEAREGDTLVVMLEPFLLSKKTSMKALGIQLAYATDRPKILQWRGENSSRTRVGGLSDLRPGALVMFSLVGKVVIGRALYRYRVEDIRPGGLLVTDYRDEIPNRDHAPTELSDDGRELLEDLARVAARKKIDLIYALPWAFSESSFAKKVRGEKELFLRDVEKIMPVLREPEMGVHSVREDFADTQQHLIPEVAKVRTKILVDHLRNRK